MVHRIITNIEFHLFFGDLNITLPFLKHIRFPGTQRPWNEIELQVSYGSWCVLCFTEIDHNIFHIIVVIINAQQITLNYTLHSNLLHLRIAAYVCCA